MVGDEEDDSKQPERNGVDDPARPAALTLLHLAKGWTPEEVEADIASEGLDFAEVIAKERAYIERLKQSAGVPEPVANLGAAKHSSGD